MEVNISIPDGKKGDWEISTFEINNADIAIHNLRAMFKPGHRTIKPGRYKKLTRNGITIMSNTQAEIKDHFQFIYKARTMGGDILINGLGLGVSLTAILESDIVKSVTVIEISQDVIDLVMPHIKDDRVVVICADAFEWKPPKRKRYDFVWHDIWDSICPDNLEEMAKLHRKYGKRAGWQGSWSKKLCQIYKSRGHRYS